MNVQTMLDQHNENCTFQSFLYQSIFSNSHYNLLDLVTAEDQLEAELDGLRVSKDAGWELVEETLAIEEPGEVFVVALLALESQQPERLKLAFEIGIKSAENIEALASALLWCELKIIEPLAPHLLRAKAAPLRYLGISATVAHQLATKEVLQKALAGRDTVVVARALRAIGELRHTALLNAAVPFLQHEEAECRFWAAWTLVLCNQPDRALPVLQSFISDKDHQLEALQLLLRVLPRSEVQLLLNQLIAKQHIRLALQCTGWAGLPEMVPWVIEQMMQPEFARVAGEAFCLITGIEIDDEDGMEGDWPEGFEAGPNDDPADDNVEMDEDEDLLWPIAPVVSAWWQEHQVDYQPGQRYLCGKPVSVTQCQHVLVHGFQRQRAAAALELALLQPKQPLFNVMVPAKRQIATMKKQGWM